MKLNTPGERGKFYGALAICLGLFFIQLWSILKYAVNIPYWDEWELITPTGLLANQTVPQLFIQQNEHRIVPTKILTLLMYRLDGWDIRTHQAVNFFIYGLTVAVLIYFVKKSVPQLPGWILLCFTFFLLTSTAKMNHFWAFQTHFHFTLLFLFVSVFFLFDDNQRWNKLIVGIIFSWLTIYSLASGIIEIFVVLAGYACYKIIRFRQNKKSSELLQLALTVLLIGAAIGCYFIGFTNNPEHPPFLYPYQKEFWLFFLNVISSGFGIVIINIIPGLLILLFVMIPVIGEIWKRGGKLPESSWKIIVTVFAVTAALGVITLGRGGFPLYISKASSYTEITATLIPLSVAMWTIFLDEKNKARNYLLAGFWIFCAISFARFWNSHKAYRMLAVERQAGYECVKDYYRNGGAADCPTIFPRTIADRLELAKDLKLSFAVEINQQIAEEKK